MTTAFFRTAEANNNYFEKILETKIKHKEWDELRNFIEKNKDLIKEQCATFCYKTLLFMCYQNNDVPISLIHFINEIYPHQVQILCYKRPHTLVTAFDWRTTVLHEGINNHISLIKLTYLLELDIRLENKLSITKMSDGRKCFPLHTFMKNFSFYLSEKDHDVLKFTSLLINMNPQAIQCKDFQGRVPLSFLLLQLEPSNEHIQDKEDIFIQVIKLIISMHDSYPRWKCDFIPIIRSSITTYSPQRLKVLSILIQACPPMHMHKSPLRLFIEMDLKENELMWLREYSSEKDLALEYCEILELLWIQHVDNWHRCSSEKTSSIRSRYQQKGLFFLKSQEACLKSIKLSIEDYKLNNDLNTVCKAFKTFWSKIHIILGCPTLMIHKLCTIQCPRALMEISVFLHQEQLSTYDKDERLPLHVALTDNTHSNALCLDYKQEKNEEWTVTMSQDKEEKAEENHADVTKADLLLQLYPEALREKDGTLNIYPFMIAAMNSNLNLCYQMLRMSPEVLPVNEH